MSTIKVDSIKSADGNTDLLTLSNGAVSGVIGGRRNLIINGAMQVAQRGTSFGSTSGSYTLDRWKAWSCPLSQSTDVPTGEGFVNSSSITVAAPSSGGFATLEQLIENEKLFAGRTFNFSFWIKGSVNGTVVIRNYSQSNTLGFGHTEVNVTTSWQRVSATITVPALGGGTSDWCGFGIDFNVNGVAGLHYSGSGVSEPSYVGTINITGVQLELGSVATPFEHRSYGEELALCQRYYQTGAFARRWTSTGSNEYNFFTHYYVTQMRAAPTHTFSGGTFNNIIGSSENTSAEIAAGIACQIAYRANATGTDTYVFGRDVTFDAEI